MSDINQVKGKKLKNIWRFYELQQLLKLEVVWSQLAFQSEGGEEMVCWTDLERVCELEQQ